MGRGTLKQETIHHREQTTQLLIIVYADRARQMETICIR